MRTRLLQHLVIIGVVVLILDWILGAMCASGMLPEWAFLLFNIPFGAIYVWMESSWVGTHYRMLGQNVGDIGSGVVFLFVVMAQSLCYFALYEWLRKKCSKRVAA
jgi:diacylglycerol kinase